jgi:nucleoid DNA-binding protein
MPDGIPCARCAATEDLHPGGYCPDVVDEAGLVEVGETRIYEPDTDGAWEAEQEEMLDPERGMVTVPVTGEIVNRNNPAEVARALAEIEKIATLAAEAKRLLNDDLVRYSQTVAAKRTFEIPGVGKFERTGGPEKTYRDPAALKKALIEAGMPPERANEIVVETVDRKVSGREANAAAKSNPVYKEIIEAATLTVDKPFRVTRKG